MHWRSAHAFTEQTDHLVDFFLHRYGDSSRNQTLEVLVGLGTRPGHPYASENLWGYLADMEMSERDLSWSQFLYYAEETSAVHRLVEWVERRKTNDLESPVAENVGRVLALFLTTNRRGLRDRATRALFRLGLAHPEALFDLTLTALAFNDPYVPERLLAACYGVAMNGWVDPTHGSVQALLPALAVALHGQMFAPDAPHATTHILMQDYALGTIQLALRLDPDCLGEEQRRYLERPLLHNTSPFPPAETISDEICKRADGAIHMDFGNYTLGHLVEHRRNYDMEHTGYQQVRQQILWRVADLGYSKERFDEVDRQIGNFSWQQREGDPGKIDRYGKKYSWIAYFEMWGVRYDAGALPDREEVRPPDCDVDPSFPPEPERWNASLPELFTTAPTDPAAWLAEGPTPSYDRLLEVDEIDGLVGPWVLLEGFIEQNAGDDARQVFTFLRGLFAAPQDLPALLSRFEAADYPGNFAIPEEGRDIYTYAGEIPWSERFGAQLRDAAGRARPDIREAFETWGTTGPVGGVPVEIPAYRFEWEGYHSSVNQVSGVLLPAPALCAALGLVNHARSWDLYADDGSAASVYREWPRSDPPQILKLRYLRLDLLQRYLQETQRQLVWLIWGERNFDYRSDFSVDDARAAVLWRHEHIHKSYALFGQDRPRTCPG